MIPLFSLPYLIFECFSVKLGHTTSDNVITIPDFPKPALVALKVVLWFGLNRIILRMQYIIAYSSVQNGYNSGCHNQSWTTHCQISCTGACNHFVRYCTNFQRIMLSYLEPPIELSVILYLWHAVRLTEMSRKLFLTYDY